MIDNFDHLVARCVAKRRRRFVRLFLFVAGVILLVVALVAGYLKMFSADDVAFIKPKKSVVTPVQTPKAVALPIDQHPITILPTVSPKEKNSDKNRELPHKNSSKAPLYVLQLTSNSSYQQVKTLFQKIPKQYQEGMGIYLVNNYYTLRYTNIYNANRIVPLITEFKLLGFEKPILFKYNPDRIPLNDKMAALIASSPNKTPAPTAQSTTQLVTAQAPVSHTTKGSVFNVTNSVQENANEAVTYQSAIVMARDFYEKNSFAEAAIWAKKANQLNREQEEAWLLYAKSYWAQGLKKEALGVLELYMNYKDSKAATQLYRTYKANTPN